MEISNTKKLNLAIIRGNKAYDYWAEKANLSNYLSVILYELLIRSKLSQKELIKLTDLPKQSINKGIHLLYEQGYISLTTSERDNRVKFCELTKDGQDYAREVMKPLIELEERVADRMGKEKMKQLTFLMTEWSDTFWKLMKEQAHK
ncbi:DNA-binding MarR family transcriptional regulator [Lactobacillus colini]|uniref:DNA-binding MarR family transcriptional regulator n=1 Tax=Lactobacillus colini TaxID=1819254 RepID=A0ABS4MCX5_9LACO|nr:helix-turn-helix domain-containing protein [Lactobacillus colini]MBP2057540.1 DNA-binding MarR family transcriptional regulator [Lactobacillus colini]